MERNPSRDKAALRRYILEQRGLQEAGAASRTCDKIAATEQFAAAKTIFIYISVDGEAGTRPIIEQAWADGKRVCVPRCRNQKMDAVPYTVNDTVKPGKYGIPEPPENRRAVSPDDIDLVIVPGMAFDRDGYRLGYGGGYYDRYLLTARYSVGLCRAEWYVHTLLREPHDRPVDLVITDD